MTLNSVIGRLGLMNWLDKVPQSGYLVLFGIKPWLEEDNICRYLHDEGLLGSVISVCMNINESATHCTKTEAFMIPDVRQSACAALKSLSRMAYPFIR
jgi:hypothetical protein